MKYSNKGRREAAAYPVEREKFAAREAKEGEGFEWRQRERFLKGLGSGSGSGESELLMVGGSRSLYFDGLLCCSDLLTWASCNKSQTNIMDDIS